MKTMLSVLLPGLTLLAALLPRAASPSSAQAPHPSMAHEVRPSADVSLFLPLVRGASSDLSITGMEITQSVQTPANEVPLVADRPTVVRVYARTNNSAAPASQISLSLAATRNGEPLAGSPLIAVPQNVVHNPSQSVYESSFNLLLPAAWLSGSVSLVATIDPQNTFAESNEQNNSLSRTLDFSVVPPLDLVIVPIQYTHTPTSRTYPALTDDLISDWVMRAYPFSAVHVTMHAPLSFVGDLGSPSGEDWSRLLNQITTLRSIDGASPAQAYYGLVPTLDGSDSWLPMGGFIAGAGWVGLMRSAVGLDLGPELGFSEDKTGEIAAHELGHNFGRRHAPCPASLSPIDAAYPYAGASVGQYGLDISHSRLWSPGAPDYAVDIMSYCDPVWISDYTYRGIYADQRLNGVASTTRAVESLLIRATLDPAGQASLSPIYQVDATPSAAAASSDYAIELLDAEGRVLSTHRVAIHEALAHGHGPQALTGAPMRAIHAVVPRPDSPVAHVRLARAGRPLASRSLAPAAPSAALAIRRDGDTLTLRWGAPDVPALARYTADGGRSWSTLGVEVLGGRLQVDVSALPGGMGRFEVILADSSTTAGSAPVMADLPALRDSAPRVWITGPTAIQAGRPLLLFGHSADREDGVLFDLRWTVDGVAFQAGQTLQLAQLAAGAHTVVLSARDSHGQAAWAEHRVVVAP